MSKKGKMVACHVCGEKVYRYPSHLAKNKIKQHFCSQDCFKKHAQERGGYRRRTLEEAKAIFAARGYTLLSDTYINSTKKLKFRCPQGHMGEMRFEHFVRGVECAECWKSRRKLVGLTPFADIQKSFEVRGYTLLSTEYRCGEKLKSLCPRGHCYDTSLSGWKCGYGCPKCAAMDNTGPNNPNWNPDREAIKYNRKIWTAWRNLLRSGASGRYHKTSEEVRNMLGYDWSVLREHMVQHPNWSKCANGFEVDHVFPVKAFLDYGITDPKIVNALENLRPLPPKENHRKNRYYDKNEFEQYLHDRNITWKKN